MSASSKKKLRREQEAAQMTEKQLAAQREAKKLKLYTAAFVAVMAVILVIAVTVGVKQTISSHGIMEKKTVALTVGDHEINNVEMNYFFMDAVNSFLNTYGSYAAMFGLDTSKPLNEQVLNQETGLTWADDFMNSAKSTAQTTYALADAAEAAGYTLSNEELTEIEYNVHNIDAYAALYGYTDGDAYLKAMYGNGASMESYLEYNKRTALADSYYNHYSESLTYDDAALRAQDSANPGAYDTYYFASYYLSASKFLTGGTEGENGITYSDEEKAASIAAAEEAANSLISEEIVTAADLDAAIAALSVNKDLESASTPNSAQAANINELYADWVTSNSRKAGDKAVFANNTTDADGNTTIAGYYVILFEEFTDNNFAMANVRHILVSFEHNHDESEEHDDSAVSYTDEEKAAAKATAEDLLKQWKAGDKTEDSFAALATEHTTDTGSAASGGLYEDVYPGQMVRNFNDWCFDDSRKTGDTGIVESEYGYHVMYYVGESDTTYRDYMIMGDLRSTDVNAWYEALIEASVMTDGDTKYINTGLVLNGV